MTWPMPMPTEAPSRASRIALDLTARTARQANSQVGEAGLVQGAPGGQRPAGGVVAGGVDEVDLLHEQAAVDRAATPARSRRAAPARRRAAGRSSWP